LSATTNSHSGISIPGTTEHFLDPLGPEPRRRGRLRYLAGGTGAPLVLLHTVRTQAEHFRRLIPLVRERYTVYALDLPGMGYSQIVPGASYDEPAMRAAVKSLITQLDLRDVTLLGESMGATLQGRETGHALDAKQLGRAVEARAMDLRSRRRPVHEASLQPLWQPSEQGHDGPAWRRQQTRFVHRGTHDPACEAASGMPTSRVESKVVSVKPVTASRTPRCCMNSASARA
jgi:alpha/beta hydrolase family protein